MERANSKNVLGRAIEWASRSQDMLDDNWVGDASNGLSMTRLEQIENIRLSKAQVSNIEDLPRTQ